MGSRQSRRAVAISIRTVLLALLLAALLPACSSGLKTSLPASPTQLPSETPQPATATASEPWIPTPFPTSLEAFGLHYDPDARLEIPPWGSVDMLFWGDAIPVKPVLETPELVSYPTPQGLERSDAGLLELGCDLDRWGWATCPPDNPLQGFGCTFLVDPRVSVSGVDPPRSLVAICKIETEEHEAARINGLYLSGCAFKTENQAIFQVEGEYVLVSSLDELKQLFVPIESPEEAAGYAQLVTGLEAIYDFTYDPTLMYFNQNNFNQDNINETLLGTHVTQVGSDFEMNLFNMQGCGCEPWFTTQATIRVGRDGLVTWVDAVPIYMTTGWSCAD